jgi:hypothetical protein
MWIVRLAQTSELDAVKGFLKKFLSARHPLFEKSGLFDWYFYSGPEKLNCAIALEEDSREIIAINGFIPGDRWGNSSGRKEVGLVNWYAKKERPGSGLAVMNFILNELGFRYGYGLGSSPDSEAIHRLLGFQLFENDQYVMLNSDITEFSVASVPKNLDQETPGESDDTITIERLRTLDDFQRCPKACWAGRFPHRSPEFCLNRYVTHSWLDYRVERISNSRGEAVVLVYRVVICNKSRIIRIIDTLGDKKDLFLVPIRISQILRSQNAEFADYSTWTDGQIDWAKLGFIDVKKAPGLIVPDHIAPLEKKNIRKVGMMTVAPSKEVCFTRGDTDQDRPA